METIFFCIVLLAVVGYLVWFAFFNPSMFLLTIPELVATFLGIYIGFALTRWVGFVRDWKRAKQALKYIKEELEFNQGKIKNMQKLDKRIFTQFKTNSWHVFSEKISVLDFDLVSKLGVLYHIFQQANEVAKIPPSKLETNWKEDMETISSMIQYLIDRIDKELNIKKE